jgi:luciferase family oxidoreductase group 1
MAPVLSVLDLSPVASGQTPAAAIRQSIEIAKAAERLGYHRYWVAEHHSMSSLAGSSPEILMAAVSQNTSRIRLGSGGLMLPNYSPLKVAEVFLTLEALAPGRIDIGLGRALGADARTGHALRSTGSDRFANDFALLCAWLLDASGKEAFPRGHAYSAVRSQPFGPGHPDPFLLVSSVDSAIFAGRAGVGMVFSEFIARSSAAAAIAAYRQAFDPGVFRTEPWAATAVIALAADTAMDAERLDAPRRAGTLAFLQGRERVPMDPDTAVADLAARKDDPALADIIARSFTGDAASVRQSLRAKQLETQADEIFVMSTGPDLPSRVRSLELLATVEFAAAQA